MVSFYTTCPHDIEKRLKKNEEHCELLHRGHDRNEARIVSIDGVVTSLKPKITDLEKSTATLTSKVNKIMVAKPPLLATALEARDIPDTRVLQMSRNLLANLTGPSTNHLRRGIIDADLLHLQRSESPEKEAEWRGHTNSGIYMSRPLHSITWTSNLTLALTLVVQNDLMPLKVIVEAFQRALRDLTASVTSLAAQLPALSQRLTSHQQSIENHTNQIVQIREAHQRQSTDFSERFARIEARADQIDREAQQRIQALQDQIAESRQREEQLDTRITQMAGEVLGLRRQIEEERQASLQREETMRASMERQVQQLRGDLLEQMLNLFQQIEPAI